MRVLLSCGYIDFAKDKSSEITKVTINSGIHGDPDLILMLGSSELQDVEEAFKIARMIASTIVSSVTNPR